MKYTLCLLCLCCIIAAPESPSTFEKYYGNFFEGWKTTPGLNWDPGSWGGNTPNSLKVLLALSVCTTLFGCCVSFPVSSMIFEMFWLEMMQVYGGRTSSSLPTFSSAMLSLCAVFTKHVNTVETSHAFTQIFMKTDIFTVLLFKSVSLHKHTLSRSLSVLFFSTRRPI